MHLLVHYRPLCSNPVARLTNISLCYKRPLCTTLTTSILNRQSFQCYRYLRPHPADPGGQPGVDLSCGVEVQQTSE